MWPGVSFATESAGIKAGRALSFAPLMTSSLVWDESYSPQLAVIRKSALLSRCQIPNVDDKLRRVK